MISRMTLKNNLIGNKDFYRRVVSLLLPIVIQNTVTNVVSLVDNLMVGAVGNLQMSAVSVVNQLLFIFYLCIFGGHAGAGIFAAQYAGAGDSEGVRGCFRMKLYIALLMVALALVVFWVFPDKLISMYIAEGTSVQDAAATLPFGKGYLAVMLIGILPFGISQAYGSTLRELGETKVPMMASVFAILINMSFNYILIFGNSGLPFLPFEGMGVIGAAIATVVSRFAEAAIIIFYVHLNTKKYEFIKGAYRTLKISKTLFENIIKKGSPLLVNEFLWSLGMAMLAQCYSLRGLDVVAASNIATTANNLFNVIFLSMGNAIAIMAGQQLGAGETDKAKTTVWRLLALSIATCLVMGGALAFFAPHIPYLFTKSTPDIREIATSLLYVVAAMMPFYAFSHGCYFTLRSGGKTVITLIFDCGFTWGLAYPLAFCLAHFTRMDIIPLYLCVQALEAVKCVIGFTLIKKGVWINNMVAKEKQ